MATNIYDVLKDSPFGAYGKFIGHTLHGINHELRNPILKNIPEGEAYVFFTKPYFNMRASNLRGDRRTTNLITQGFYNNAQTFIRQTLDPDLAFNGGNCPLVDRESPWIPVLTNTLKSMSGWPDRVLPVFTSTPGSRGEQYSMADGIIETNGRFDLTMQFEKMDGRLNERLLEIWMLMMSLQVDGIVWPYPWQESYLEKNYDTSIYVLIMDSTNRLVVDVARVISAFPINDNKGSHFNINNKKIDRSNEFSIRFECNIVEYSDPIDLYEFNLATAKWNIDIFNLIFNGDKGNLVEIPRHELSKHKSLIPYIDLSTNELIWYGYNK